MAPGVPERTVHFLGAGFLELSAATFIARLRRIFAEDLTVRCSVVKCAAVFGRDRRFATRSVVAVSEFPLVITDQMQREQYISFYIFIFLYLDVISDE